jgi:hypothetical protein
MVTEVKKEKGHIATAIKALEKQIVKNNAEAQKHINKSEEHQKTAQFYLNQTAVLSDQINTLKGE